MLFRSVFNPNVSFQVLIMALLGGPTHWLGPLAGVIPLTALFELLAVKVPDYFSVLLGATFLVIVYVLPGGVTALAARWRARRSAAAHQASAQLSLPGRAEGVARSAPHEATAACRAPAVEAKPKVRGAELAP